MHTALERYISVKGTEEEMRILYVALTRARENLFVTGIIGAKAVENLEKTKEIVGKYYSRHTVFSCKSYLEWIYSALAVLPSDRLSEFCEINFREFSRESFLACGGAIFSDSKSASDVSANDKMQQDASELPVPDEKTVNFLYEKMNFTYSYSYLSRIPAKITVSKLYPSVLDDTAGTLDLDAPKAQAAPPRFFTSAGTDTNAADRGSATHVFFQFCDIERLEKYGVDAEIERLTARKFMPVQFGELIYRKDISNFLGSELMSVMRASRKIIREQWFNVLLPATRFSRDAGLSKRQPTKSLPCRA